MRACVNCKYAGRPSYKSPCSECHGYSKHEAVEIRTNGDRIRAMRDEELAKFLTHINPANCQDCAFSVGWRCQPDRDDYSDFDKCKEGRKRWLKQPVEEVKG